MKGLRRRGSMIVVALGLATAGCGKGEAPTSGGAADPSGAAGSADPKAHEAAIKAVQDKVPAGLDLVFEAVVGDKDRHVAVQPKGWETGVIPGRVKPPAGSPLGFLTAFSTGSNCDGSCEPKDWAKVADGVEFAQFKGGGWTIDKDEALPDGRLLVARQEGRVDIALARWKADASRYFVCRATLDKEVIGAAAAFEEACRQMVVESW